MAELFDLLAPAYEIIASDARIRTEIDALEPQLRALGIGTLLDAGCAVGGHSRELARRGFSVAGIDRSAAMIAEARKRTGRSKLGIRFVQADLTDAARIAGAPFDAILCLGNTIGSLRTEQERRAVLRSFCAGLRPGGLLVLQMRDLSAVRDKGHVFPVRSARKGRSEWILLREQEPAGGKIVFRTTLLHRRSVRVEWQAFRSSSVLRIVPAKGWIEQLRQAGFVRVRAASDLHGTPRARTGGADLVLFARAGA
ncbi:MAG: methyltransferase domain-containing protein [Candidatus Eisenbacteria bacterium]|nr:methyltransferase domain-containing protein [Candidatus Eisenbacteria bacterium]